jgi:HD superfamily phosphohydrolase
MSRIGDIPEISLSTPHAMVRIAPELDVPITPRVRRLIDTAAFRRLSHIRQLGLVALVYPGAVHTRFEHSLGVYRLAVQFLGQMAQDDRFNHAVASHDAELFLVAALLHDIGHWPFCHPIEDMRLPTIPAHERSASSFLLEDEMAELLRVDWGISPAAVATLLAEKPKTATARVLSSMLSGPIDVDKMDYLLRDSLHAGVPYGRNFDQGRLLAALCLNERGDALAITDKGKTAAEMMVFARYVMFSEVYWHHGVRSATAMLQRAFHEVHEQIAIDQWLRATDDIAVEMIQRAAKESPASDLVDGLFGPRRQLYKRVAQFSWLDEREWFERLARRPYLELVACAERFAKLASSRLGKTIASHEILFDAPPPEREIEFHIEVFFPKQALYRRLDEVSPVVRALAREQFDDYVKRVRVFAHPRVADDLRNAPQLRDIMAETIAALS